MNILDASLTIREPKGEQTFPIRLTEEAFQIFNMCVTHAWRGPKLYLHVPDHENFRNILEHLLEGYAGAVLIPGHITEQMRSLQERAVLKSTVDRKAKKAHDQFLASIENLKRSWFRLQEAIK